MAYWHISNAGTNTTYTGQGSRTWPAVASQFNISNIQTVMNSIAADDEIVFDDDTFDISTAFNDQSNAVTGGNTLNMGSRSNDASLCLIRVAGATNRLIQFNDTTLVKNWVVSNITFTASAANTWTGGAFFFLIGLQTGSVTFDSCVFGPMTSTGNIAATTGHFITSSGDARTITFTDCTFTTLSSGASNEHGGMVRVNTGDTLVFTGCTINGNSMSSTGGNTNGFVHANGNITISSTTISSNTVTTQDGVGRTAFALVNCQGNNTLTSDSVTFTGNTYTGGGIHGFGFYCEGTYNVTNPTAYNNSAYVTTDNSIGGLLVSYGANATGTLKRPIVYNNDVAHGAGFYNSQGGSGTVEGGLIYSNTSHGVINIGAGGGGGIYSGGWGDITINGTLVYGNTADEGGGIYLHQHSSGATRNKVCTLNNVTVIDNVITNTQAAEYPGASGGEGIDAENGNATYSLTININNSIVMGNTNSGTGNTKQIDVTAGGAGTTALNMDYIHIEGTAAVEAPATAGNLTVTTTNEVTTTPTFEYDPVTGTTYRPANGSSAGAYTGKKVYTGGAPMVDAAGRPYPLIPPLGGLVDAYGAFYPVNL